MYHYGILFGLGILVSVMAIVLLGFFGYHLYLVSKGTTTNETLKWQDLIEDVIEEVKKRKYNRSKQEGVVPSETPIVKKIMDK